jgi:fructokinase|tara:strand:+ start:510 stop:1433 length:924 start_codon:yes stop_codon:yes gene_type:complete
VANNRIGIDLGGTKIEAIILGGDGEISLRRRIDTPGQDYDEVIGAITRLTHDIEQEAGITEPLPLGICTPGAVSLKTQLMKNCNSTCLNGKPLRQDLTTQLSRPVRIANDADCFTLSEATDGAASEADNVFGVILGTGVGGGICINGKLLNGANAIAGEWGHNPLALDKLQETVRPDRKQKRSCYCGRYDCVESWLAGPALERSYKTSSDQKKDAASIVALAENGDPCALKVMDSYHQMLALAIANVINILDPQIIVLGGGMSNTDSLYAEVPGHLADHVFSDRVDTKIVQAKHGDSSGVRGAAWLW